MQGTEVGIHFLDPDCTGDKLAG